MSKKSQLELKASETIRFLTDVGLITKADSLNICLIKELCAEWQLCTSSTQRGAISKEIRACLEALPKPETKVSDEAQEFLDSLKGDV